MCKPRKPTIAELEQILKDEESSSIEIMPDGSIKDVKPKRKKGRVAEILTRGVAMASSY